MTHYVSIEQLLESGAHFGHLTRRWNPKMSEYVFGERNGIHIIDLRKTQVLVSVARNAVFHIAERGRNILYVGTKPQAKDTIESLAKKAGLNYVSERWLGGMLTNFQTIRKSIKRLNTIDKMETDGTFEKITKKERLLLTREKDRLRKVFGGIEDMTRLPGAIFVVDIRKEHLAIKEAKILGIPVIGIVDTNTDPEDVDYPIPANDDSIKTIELILNVMTDAIIEGSKISRIRMAEMSAEKERTTKEQESGDQEDGSKVQRKFRERRTRRGGGGDRGPRQQGGERQEQGPRQEQTPRAEQATKNEAKLEQQPKAEPKQETNE